MKNKLPIVGICACIALLATACSTSRIVYRYDESTSRYLEPTMNGYVTPIAVDLRIDTNKIVYVENFANTLNYQDVNNIENSGTIEYLKSYTIAQAVKNYSADVIVAPIFDVKTSEDFSTITITITGFPAHYINFRKATTEDINLIFPNNKEIKIAN